MKYVLIPIIYFLLGLYCILSAQTGQFDQIRHIDLKQRTTERTDIQGSAEISSGVLTIRYTAADSTSHQIVYPGVPEPGEGRRYWQVAGKTVQILMRGNQIDRIVIGDGVNETTTIIESRESSASIVIQDDVIMRSSLIILFALFVVAYMVWQVIKWAAPRIDAMQQYKDKEKRIYDDTYRDKYNDDPHLHDTL